MKEIIFASSNRHKIEEMNAILGDKVRLTGLHELGWKDEIPEDGDTLEFNALQKARIVFSHFGKAVIADDTGLEVEALNGAPGVYSARYAGEPRSDEANRAKLLRELGEEQNRRARFRTVIAFIDHSGEFIFEGVVNGQISKSENGTGGFGYDAMFIPDGHDRSFAEMDSGEKNRISHRGRAAEAFAAFIRTL